MKMRAVLVLLASLTLTLNAIGCADGKGSRKTRIASTGPGKVTSGTEDKNKQQTQTADDAKQDGPSNDDTQTGGTGTNQDTKKKSDFDQNVDDEINAQFAEFLKSKTVDLKQLAGKKLSINAITLKIFSSAANLSQDSYSAIAHYEAKLENGEVSPVLSDKVLKAQATGSPEGINNYALPVFTNIEVDANGKIVKTQEAPIVLRMKLESSAVSINADLTGLEKSYILPDLNEILSSGLEKVANEKGAFDFSSNGVDGAVQFIQSGNIVTIVIEIQVDSQTTQVFAISYSV